MQVGRVLSAARARAPRRNATALVRASPTTGSPRRTTWYPRAAASVAAPLIASRREPINVVVARAHCASPGLGVSATWPAAPRWVRSTTARGNASSPPNCPRTSCLLARGGRDRMRADDQLESIRHGRRLGTHDETRANRHTLGDGKRHRRRGLSRRHAKMLRPVDRRGAKRIADELTRVDRANTGPDDGQEIVSKLFVRTRQWERLGSDQADIPVTTSNFFRSELTNWGASSCVESCSSWLRIFASAASTSVIALSE